MSDTTDAVLVADIALAGVLVMRASLLAVLRRVRNAVATLDALLPDAAAPELEDAGQAPTTPEPPAEPRRPRTHRLSNIEIEVYTIRFVKEARWCREPDCPSCRIVNDTAGRLP